MLERGMLKWRKIGVSATTCGREFTGNRLSYEEGELSRTVKDIKSTMRLTDLRVLGSTAWS